MTTFIIFDESFQGFECKIDVNIYSTPEMQIKFAISQLKNYLHDFPNLIKCIDNKKWHIHGNPLDDTTLYICSNY